MRPPSTRHYVLYARQNWRDMRFLLFLVFVLYFGFSAYDVVRRHFVRVAIEQGIFYTLLPLVLIPLVRFITRLNYVEFGPDSVHIRLAFRTTRIPYTDIEKARTDTVEHLFERPDRKRMRSAIVRRLYKESALCLRLRDDDGQVDRVRRRLGARSVLDREVALPISDLEAAMQTVKGRLATRRSQAAVTTERPRSGRGRKRHR